MIPARTRTCLCSAREAEGVRPIAEITTIVEANLLTREAARSFGDRDIRFAETLDKLGLVTYSSGDFEVAEMLPGAAVAEMLLALGPPKQDLAQEAELSCRSSVATYLVRLGWIYDRQGRESEISLLMQEPYRILERGYVPHGSQIDRLEWLISQYLLVEDFAAADWLVSMQESHRFSQP